MSLKSTSPALSFLAVLFVALALSIGWGVRGNWGHEYGAMIPGALAAMAAVLVSGREDWYRRIPFFAFFGAVGWSFGGSISYMHVIAYTHSGHALSVVYGFACLFLIGFLWAAIGGAGTALPAFLSRDRLTELLIPVSTVFAAWVAQDIFFNVYFAGLRKQVQDGIITREQLHDQVSWINWHDTDWIAVVVAAAALLVLSAVRRRICWGTSLALHLCAGWWLGFTALTIGLGLRMTPPRGDNWAGALGMTVAMFVFLRRQRELGVAWAALVTGLFGGLGFSGATLVKLILIHPGLQERFLGGPTTSNWHSVLEQSFGFVSGVGVGLVMGCLASWAPKLSELPPVRRWAEPLLVFFVMLVITYVNIVKNIDAVWLTGENPTLQPLLWGYSSHTWFNLAYIALAVTVAWPLWAYYYRGRHLEILPSSSLGKGQLFFVIFLWWIIMGNLARTVPFHEQRLITEGVIHVNACLCTLLALLLPCRDRMAGEERMADYAALLRQAATAAVLGTALVILGEFGLVRAMWGDTFAGQAGLHIRFGPDATLDKK
ncbi:MAG TPA: hypothetical protein VGZ26_11075 [Pirellulales bacterium]|jgi:hypothetical protein|nr:hypothetical protein [Pirellulales bacterium]